MGWIKRNLFFVIGGVLALGLLGGAAFFIFQGLSRNSAASAKLNEIYQNLQTTQSPGNDKIDNTKIAQAHEKELRAWINSIQAYFNPIPPIPPTSPVSSEAYAASLRRTIDQLQREADNLGVALPPRYDFSFSAERSLVRFAANSLEPLAAQLGEVKAITQILFAARINALDSIQRVHVSEDDVQGPQSDYLDHGSITNELAIITPYVVTFRSFSPELARVLAGFATASNTIIVKAINVLPAGAAQGIMPMGEAGLTAPQMPGRYITEGPMNQPAPPPVATPPAAGRGGLQTVLKEQLLRITMEIEIVKLLPKS